MLLEDVVLFLKNVPPFQFLDGNELQAIAGRMSMEFYPRNTVILKQDGPPSENLLVIKKGGAKVFIRSEDGEEALTDYRGEGDLIGYLSLFSGDKSRANVVTVEDTICYLIQKDTIQEIVDRNAAIREYFHKSFVSKYVDKTFSEMYSKSLMVGGGDKLLFTTTVGELATKGVISASLEISIQEAAVIMSGSKISSLVLVDANSVPAGIVTDRDLRDKVVSKGRDFSENIRGIMSSTLIKAEAREYCFEALLKMIRHNIHHLLVVDDGRLKGIITNHDLMMLQGVSPITVARDIDIQNTVEGLVIVSKKINKIISMLIKQGAKATNTAKIISEINDRLVKKALEIAEKKYGAPPLPYCWMALGSEGRKEQTFKTDQDNAIIYADPASDVEEEKAKKYFSDFTVFVRDGLLKCGVPLCPAGYMSSNPEWCRPLHAWKRHFSDWISTPTAEALLNSLIFFDFRPLHGDFSLSSELRDSLVSMLEGNTVFFGNLANMIIKNRPPIGFLKSFVVEKSGEHKNELNLKIKGIAPLVDIVRLFALERGIKETSTVERIEALKAVHTIVMEYAEELEHAFEFLMLLRLHLQFEQIEKGTVPDNFINPDNLSNLEKKTMKDTFQLISKMQDSIIERYKGFIW